MILQLQQFYILGNTDPPNIYAIAFGVLGGVLLLAVAVVVLVRVVLFSKTIKTIRLIKNRLTTAFYEEIDAPVLLTKNDELNAVLAEIDSLGTKLHKALRRQKRERDQRDFILENVEQGILAIDKDYNVILANGIACDLFGFMQGKEVDIRSYVRDSAVLKGLERTMEEDEIQVKDFVDKNGLVWEFRFLPAHD
ncbi:MAG: hypothetical protein FWC82_00640, partial [Firmicutes bacterium]|nr:hypothetical protein [Bacillota bacterium]